VIEQKMQIQGELRIRDYCELAEVSRSSYYRRWQQRQPSEEEMALRSALQRMALSRRHYGYRRLTRWLRRDGWSINHKRVLRLMREDNLLSLRRKRFVITTNSDHGWRVYPNLARSMSLSGINQLWVADLTYVRLREEFIYVGIILDVYSRRVVGWSIGERLDSNLAQQALSKALQSGSPQIHHSDRGVQYACRDYVAMLEQRGIQISMSRPGNPYDNAFAESFMKTLKSEEVDGRHYANLKQAEQSIRIFIEEFYNSERLHSALGYRSPVDFEAVATGSDWAGKTEAAPRHIA